MENTDAQIHQYMEAFWRAEAFMVYSVYFHHNTLSFMVTCASKLVQRPIPCTGQLHLMTIIHNTAPLAPLRHYCKPQCIDLSLACSVGFRVYYSARPTNSSYSTYYITTAKMS